MNQATQTRTIPDRGYDLDARNRPGVPMETRPAPIEGAHELAPVVGTAQPLSGVSGIMRRLAYAMPQHEARRWALLLMADRVDAMEHGAWRGRAVAGLLALGLLAGTTRMMRMRGRRSRRWTPWRMR